MATDVAVYLYGLVPAAAPQLDVPGLQDARVSVVPLDDTIGVLSSDYDGTEVQPRRAHLSAHDGVLAAAMAAGPVLPLKFGIVADDLDPETILADLDTEAVLDRMHALRGLVEVQVLWELDEDAALRRVAASVPAARDDRLNPVDRGRLVADALTTLAVTDLEQVLPRLAPLATGRPEPRGTLAARAPVLVRATAHEQFVATGESVAAALVDLGDLRLVGALPPYSFADGGVTWDS